MCVCVCVCVCLCVCVCVCVCLCVCVCVFVFFLTRITSSPAESFAIFPIPGHVFLKSDSALESILEATNHNLKEGKCAKQN